ncbi:hypothetical protein HPB51_010644 [Rhipicephalus microplus]|uniref:Uncharacterized protein n=1 Tax=Rhipicephalus microplus TaxID=6941 RepID=A0A9J6EP60_RHIMP|nr:hypothetical protein HPB51_010644 [Rhipicephalus microplus]
MSPAAVSKHRRNGKFKQKPPFSGTEMVARFTTDEKRTKTYDAATWLKSPPLLQKKETAFTGEKGVLSRETQTSEGLTEQDAMIVAMQLRATLQERGPSHENYLLETLLPSQSQRILAAHGTLFAFLNHQPGFQVQHAIPHSLVYYHNHDSSDESIPVGASLHPTPSSSIDNEHRCSDDLALSDAGNERTMRKDDDGQEKCRMKDRSIQVTSPPGRKTRGLQKAEQMIDSGEQTQISDTCRLAQLQAMLWSCDTEIAALEKKIETTLKSNAMEIQLLEMKIATLPKKSSTVPPTSTAQVTNCHTKEPTCKDESGAQIIPGPSQTLQPQLRKSLSLRATQPEVEPRLLPVVAIDQADEKSTKRGKRRPDPLFRDFPGRATKMDVPFLNAECSPSKCDMERKLSRIVEMVRKKHPEHTEEDTRRSMHNVRRSMGGFSRMTFNAIVALVHSDLEASRKENR